MQIKCIHCENGIRKNPNLGYAHVLPGGEVIDCPFETREYRAQKLQHLTKRALDVCRYRWGEGMETGEHSYVNGVCGKCGKRQ